MSRAGRTGSHGLLSSGSCGITWDEAKAGENQDLYDRFIKTAIEFAIQENDAWYCWHASRNQIMVEQVWKRTTGQAKYLDCSRRFLLRSTRTGS